ncbi:hypothetical protein E2C01_038267 [Portunus trituberculatus]|uniref:Uncharacterized protein n=1 Tax=Portunus trituberculatus TaxID=210409 RepID=A0A5B7FBS4_PORTR|nr:hypothetical protein [Portunus trituberculatus]
MTANGTTSLACGRWKIDTAQLPVQHTRLIQESSLLETPLPRRRERKLSSVQCLNSSIYQLDTTFQTIIPSSSMTLNCPPSATLSILGMFVN